MIRLGPGRYFGQTECASRFGPFAITATRYWPGQRLPKHYHGQPYLFVMLSGAMGETTGSREHLCTRGWLVFNEVGESHCDVVFEQGARGLNVELPPDWLADFRADRGAHEPIVYRHAGPAVTAVGTLQLAMRVCPAIRAFAVEEAVTCLIDALRSPPVGRAGSPRWLEAAEEHIRTHFRDGLSFSAIAADAGVHPAHLCREFRRKFGCTMSQYAARLRCDDAFLQLVDSQLSLAAIAARTGFADQAHLTRSIRRYFGNTPSRLRQDGFC
jgi:AraC family transcriptional regulator